MQPMNDTAMKECEKILEEIEKSKNMEGIDKKKVNLLYQELMLQGMKLTQNPQKY